MTSEEQENPLKSISWKTHLAFLLIAMPMLPTFLKQRALKRLYTEVVLNPEAMACLLLSRIGSGGSAEFMYYIYNLLLGVPEESFKNKWVEILLTPFDALPGDKVRKKIGYCEEVILQSFGLWHAVATGARSGIDENKLT